MSEQRSGREAPFSGPPPLSQAYVKAGTTERSTGQIPTEKPNDTSSNQLSGGKPIKDVSEPNSPVSIHSTLPSTLSELKKSNCLQEKSGGTTLLKAESHSAKVSPKELLPSFDGPKLQFPDNRKPSTPHLEFPDNEK